MRLTIAATGPQPPSVTWERYERLALWPTWSPYILSATPSGALLSAGLTGTLEGPARVRVAYRVDAVDAARRQWAWTVRLGPVRVSLRHGIDAVGRPGPGPGPAASSPSPAGSVAWLVLRGPAPVLLGYAPLAEWSLHRLVTLPAG